MTTNYGFDGGNLPKWTGKIDATGNQVILTPNSSQAIALSNLPATAAPSGSWATSRGPNSDKENYAQADMTLKLNLGALTSFKTGFRTADHTFEKRTERAIFAANVKSGPTANLYNGSIEMGPNGWSSPRANTTAMLADTNANIAGWVEQRNGYGALNEKILPCTVCLISNKMNCMVTLAYVMLRPASLQKATN